MTTDIAVIEAPLHGELCEVAASASEIAAAAKADPNFLGGLAMPTVFEYYLPPVFLSLWSKITELAHASRRTDVPIEDLFARLAVGLPRGFGKTTVIKLFFLYCILFTNRQFLLLLSVTASHARNIIADIVDMLDEPNIKAVFGDWRLGLEKDTQDLLKFGFRGRNIILAGIGAGGNVRGILLKNARPDVMVFEDVQSREDAESQVVSESLYKWMLGTAMKARSPKRCLTIFVANMYPTPYSILKKLKANPHWVKFIAGGIKEDGTSLWEALHPIEQLLIDYMADLEAGHPEIFHSEVLNDEHAAVNNLLDLSKVQDYPFDDNDIPLGKFIVIDPSNDKHNSDNVAIGYFEVHGNSVPVLCDLLEDRLSPGDTIREALKLALKHNCYLVGIESNAYQYSLLYWFGVVTGQLGIQGIKCVDVYSGRLSKPTRILNMFKSYAAGEIAVHPKCKSQVHLQIGSYRPLKTDNIDNTLDLLTYAPVMVSLYSALMSAYTDMQTQDDTYDLEHMASDRELAAF